MEGIECVAGNRSPGLADVVERHSLKEEIGLTMHIDLLSAVHLTVLCTRNRLSQHVLDKRTEL